MSSPNDQDPFDALGLPARFDLDEAELRRRYLSLCAEHHPDRFTNPLDQAEAVRRSAAVNDAYQRLKDPESRANALLGRLGGASAEADPSLPPQLLAEMMETREELEEARQAGDEARVGSILQEAAERRSALIQRIAQTFQEVQSGDEPQAGQRERLLASIRQDLNTLRYYQRMLQQSAQV